MTPEERFNVVVNHAFGGWHHVFGEKRQCEGKQVSFWIHGGISTWDFNLLTKLVVAAHVVRIRAEVESHGFGRLKIWLNIREDNPNAWTQHHPSGEGLKGEVDKLLCEVKGGQV